MAIYKATFKGSLPQGDIWTMGLGLDAPINIDQAQTVAESFMTNWKTTVIDDMPVDFTFDEVTTYLLNAATGRATDARTGGSTWEGTAATGALPGQNSCVFSLRTGLPGRAMRGRCFWPAPALAALDAAGNLLAAEANVLVAAFAAALSTSQSSAAGAAWSIIHKNGATGVLTTTPVTQVQLAQVLGTQRRRTNKVARQIVSAPVN